VTTELVTQPDYLLRAGGPAHWHFGALLTLKATSEQTAGRMWAKELVAPRGMDHLPLRRRAAEVRGHDRRSTDASGSSSPTPSGSC
jgi:hypothetical protein